MPILQFNKTETGKISVSGLRAEECGDLIFLDHISAKIGDKTFGLLIVWMGPHHIRQHIHVTVPLHRKLMRSFMGGMDTFQMNPKAICPGMAFHQPHDMQAFYRMHNVKRLPTGPHTPRPNRAEMGVRLFKKVSLSTRGYSLQKSGPDHFGTEYSCPVEAQGSNGEKYSGDFKW